MKTCPPQDKLRQLLSEELQETDRDGFDRHVAECATCQSVLDGLTDDTLSTELSTIDRVAVSVDREPALDALLVRLKQQHVDEFARRIEADAQPSEPEEIRFPGPATPDAPLGQLGQYQILEELGSGATGCLFKARDTKLGRFVAVKVLKQELAALKSARERFNREARAAAALDHDNIVTIHEVGDTPGFPPYLVLECIAGESLHQRLERQRVLQPRAAAEIAEQIARGLAAAHDCGVIHRDVKPSNIMLEQATGRAKITDFGLARIPESAAGLTVEGTIAGTPVYMSPEQIIHPQEVDGQTDVYSIGVILYELLTGVLPFRGVMRMVLTQVLNDDPQPPRRLNDSIPRDLETICLKAMSKEASQRYATAAELADDLSRWLEGKPVLARPIGSLGRLVRWT